MKYIKISLLALMSLMFQACVAGKHLSNEELFQKAIVGCPNPEMAIILIPSRGLAGDAIAIASVKTMGSDGGFSSNFSTYLKLDMKNIGVSCPNAQKLEAILLNNFSLYKNNELKGVDICAIGISNSQEVVSEATRTGASVTFVPSK
ncbi:MAG: hypothetical protein FP820_11065 [Sulfurimonas sp.]|nr:hypothetical protein [Sulfurimonas sp.]MBU4025222.1 hypothetical protein [bacterium]MBU4110101.1 hypothetical protein [bacterium]